MDLEKSTGEQDPIKHNGKEKNSKLSMLIEMCLIFTFCLSIFSFISLQFAEVNVEVKMITNTPIKISLDNRDTRDLPLMPQMPVMSDENGKYSYTVNKNNTHLIKIIIINNTATNDKSFDVDLIISKEVTFPLLSWCMSFFK